MNLPLCVNRTLKITFCAGVAQSIAQEEPIPWTETMFGDMGDDSEKTAGEVFAKLWFHRGRRKPRRSHTSLFLLGGEGFSFSGPPR